MVIHNGVGGTADEISECRFEDTACVLLNAKGEMLGTRVNGIVSSALRDIPGAAGPGGKWSKVLALASKVSGDMGLK